MTPPDSRATSDHIALLRGINVGGKNKLPMKSLVAIFEEAGCAEVRTYIQSGNVVFAAPNALARRLPDVVTKRIAAKHRLQVPVITRSLKEWRAAERGNPFLKSGADPSSLHVMFLASKPAKQQGARLDPDRSPGDSFELRGREIYLHLPNGVARSKLTNAWFDTVLGTTSTGRNWRTVLKLLDMAEGT